MIKIGFKKLKIRNNFVPIMIKKRKKVLRAKPGKKYSRGRRKKGKKIQIIKINDGNLFNTLLIKKYHI